VRLGARLACYANALDMKVIAWSPNLTEAKAQEVLRPPRQQKSDLMGSSDVISAAETDDAKRFAGEAYVDRHAVLETAGSHGPIGSRDGAGRGDHQAKRQLGGSVGSARTAACCVADRNAMTRASRDVQRSV
jgi:hypothetical protein